MNVSEARNKPTMADRSGRPFLSSAWQSDDRDYLHQATAGPPDREDPASVEPVPALGAAGWK